MFFCLAAVIVPLASKRPTTCQMLDEIEANHATISNGGPVIMNTDATVGGDRKIDSTGMRLFNKHDTDAPSTYRPIVLPALTA